MATRQPAEGGFKQTISLALSVRWGIAPDGTFHQLQVDEWHDLPREQPPITTIGVEQGEEIGLSKVGVPGKVSDDLLLLIGECKGKHGAHRQAIFRVTVKGVEDGLGEFLSQVPPAGSQVFPAVARLSRRSEPPLFAGRY